MAHNQHAAAHCSHELISRSNKTVYELLLAKHRARSRHTCHLHEHRLGTVRAEPGLDK